MQRLLTLLFILLLSGGCASNALVDPQAGNQSIQNSDLAYVLVGYSGDAYSLWQHNSLHYSAAAEKHQRAEFDSNVFGQADYFFLELMPGTYTLTEFIQHSGNYVFSISEEAQEQNELLKHRGGLIGSFSADKGKITYIGNLGFSVDIYTSGINLSVRDQRNEALDYLRQNYPNINPDKLFNVKLTLRGSAP